MLKLVANSSSRDFDPLFPDAYVHRMAAVSDKCGIHANETILNTQGVPLVEKNVRITPEIASVLVLNRLRKPIEESVFFEHELGATELEKHFIAVMHQDDLLLAINEQQNLVDLIKPYVFLYEQLPLLRQKLSVMALTQPDTFVRTLYCSWFSLLLAKEMHFSEVACSDIFIAALAHDIGMLHLNSVDIENKNKLSPEDWRHLQSHIAISVALLKRMPQISADVIDAVTEHHERCDGTGYPNGKVESELTYAGKIVALADSLIAIYNNRTKQGSANWRDVIPVIQMNAQAYFFRHDEILATIWRRSKMPFKNVVQGSQLPEFVAELLRENERLNSWFEVLRSTLLSLGFIHGDRRLHSIQNIMLHVTTSVKGSGVFSAEMNEYLRHLDENHDEDVHRKIEKAHIQQQDIVFHLQRLNRMMQLYIDSGECKNVEHKRILIRALEKTKSYSN